MTRLDQLRCALKYSSDADRRAIRAMIREIECGFTASPALSQAAPESAVLDPARVVVTSCDPGVDATPHASPKGEDNGSQSNVETAARALYVPGTAGSLVPCDPSSPDATSTRACALAGCPNRISLGEKRLYCSDECANQARRLSRQSWTSGWRSQMRGATRGAQTVAAQSARARAIDNAPPATETEYRQAPLPRPSFTLSWDSAVVIRPDRPAPPRRYTNGRPTEFQDDLAARGDHGSPGHLPRLDGLWQSPTVSALAGAI